MQAWKSGNKEGLAVAHYSLISSSQSVVNYKCQYKMWFESSNHTGSYRGLRITAILLLCSLITEALLSHLGDRLDSNHRLLQCAWLLHCFCEYLSVSLELLSPGELVHTPQWRRFRPTWALLLRRGADQTPRSTGCFSVSTVFWISYILFSVQKPSLYGLRVV